MKVIGEKYHRSLATISPTTRPAFSPHAWPLWRSTGIEWAEQVTDPLNPDPRLHPRIVGYDRSRLPKCCHESLTKNPWKKALRPDQILINPCTSPLRCPRRLHQIPVEINATANAKSAPLNQLHRVQEGQQNHRKAEQCEYQPEVARS